MTCVDQVPVIKLLGTLNRSITFVRLCFIEMCSEWSKRYFRHFRVFWEFRKVNIFILPFFKVNNTNCIYYQEEYYTVGRDFILF